MIGDFYSKRQKSKLTRKNFKCIDQNSNVKKEIEEKVSVMKKYKHLNFIQFNFFNK